MIFSCGLGHIWCASEYKQQQDSVCGIEIHYSACLIFNATMWLIGVFLNIFFKAIKLQSTDENATFGYNTQHLLIG